MDFAYGTLLYVDKAKPSGFFGNLFYYMHWGISRAPFFEVYERGLLYLPKGRFIQWDGIDSIVLVKVPVPPFSWVSSAVDISLSKGGRELAYIPTNFTIEEVHLLRQILEKACGTYGITVKEKLKWSAYFFSGGG